MITHTRQGLETFGFVFTGITIHRKEIYGYDLARAGAETGNPVDNLRAFRIQDGQWEIYTNPKQ